MTENALAVLHAAALDAVDVVAGAARPLLCPGGTHCPEIHGASGLDGPAGGALFPPARRRPLPGKAPAVMFERIAAAAGQGRRVHLVATAALTNVALLLTLFPEVLPMLEAVVIMGGALGECGSSLDRTVEKGNTNPKPTNRTL